MQVEGGRGFIHAGSTKRCWARRGGGSGASEAKSGTKISALFSSIPAHCLNQCLQYLIASFVSIMNHLCVNSEYIDIFRAVLHLSF